MKRVLLIYLVLIIGIVAWYLTAGKGKRVFSNPKATALKVSTHSKQFNESIEAVMDNYYNMTDKFVKEDTVAIDKAAGQLRIALDKFHIDELKNDSSIYETAAGILDNTRSDISAMPGAASLQSKREALNLFSNELFTLLLTVRYDLAKLYWQECPSAFGEDTPGNWISSSEQSENPYGSKGCATLKKVINFLPVDSARH